MRDLSKLNFLRDIGAENRAIVARFGAAIALEFWGIELSPIEPKIVKTESKSIPVKLDLDAILALQTLMGITKAEASKQVASALAMLPNGSTQEIVTLCLKGSK